MIGTPTYDAINNQITFSIKWDNSWLVNSGPSNNDAVWVFIKRQPCGANGIWSHALLSTTSNNHSVTGAYSLEVNAVADGMGVFIKRSSSASNLIGSFSNTSSVKLQLTNNYNPALIGSSSSSDNFKVIGVEMAYVPQSEFYIGDGRSTNTNNFSAGNTVGSFLVNASSQANGLGSYTNYVSSPVYGSVVSLPNTYPIGYAGFYCMKYEINQQQIVDFLNTLSYDQQAARLGVWTGRVPSIVGTYFSNAANNYRNEIKVTTAGTNNTIPAIFGLNNSWNANIPAGFLNWQDLASYLDWAGLRPMSEFEYEKASRGTRAPISYEYPWGTTIINTSSGNFSAQNTSTESSNTIYEGNCWYNWDAGPIRSGFAASATSNRSQSGASYYGIMELGGNVFEQCVGGGSNYNYSSFTNSNGDGRLTNTGLANVIGWPFDGGISSGTILRGGSFYSNTSNNYQIQVSDRSYYTGSALNANTNRDRAVGGRGVRSF